MTSTCLAYRFWTINTGLSSLLIFIFVLDGLIMVYLCIKPLCEDVKALIYRGWDNFEMSDCILSFEINFIGKAYLLLHGIDHN